MAAVKASQTTPVQITHVFVLWCCVVLHKSCVYESFYSIKVYIKLIINVHN